MTPNQNSDDYDGGSVFPYITEVTHVYGTIKESTTGITLRDHFAISILPYMIQNKDIYTIDGCVREAYRYADAMLKERRREK